MTGTNFHTHTNWSDGKSSADETIQQAIKEQMTVLGFSDHVDLPFENNFAIARGQLPNYIEEIRSLARVYQDKVKILCGLEVDYIPGVIENFEAIKNENKLDYVIGSVHMVTRNYPEIFWFIDGPERCSYDDGLERFFGNNIREAVRSFYDQTNEMIEHEKFEIIGHFDKIKMHNHNRFFTEDERWYRNLVLETLDLIRQKNRIVEVNTRGVYKKRCDSFFPSDWILSQMNEMHIPALVSSDAHQHSELQLLFPEALKSLQKAGYKEIVSFTEETWIQIPIDGLKK
jgi:histidinol-phosphatase (PHP family)